jgi:hypothetical protein
VSISLFLAGITIWSVWTARSEVPWRDQWIFLDDARRIMAHDWGRLWYCYWGHRPVVARLVTLLDVRFFRGLNTPVIALILVLQGLHAGLLTWISWRLFGRASKAVFLIAAGLIVQLSFTSLQLENLIWAAQSGYILVWTSATIAFLTLALCAGTVKMRGIVLGAAVISGATSMLSSPNGVFVWPILIWQAWILGLSIRIRGLLTLLGVVAIGAYFWGYQPGPEMGMGALPALLHPERSIPVLGMLIAGTLTSVSVRAAMVVGCIGLVLGLHILVKSLRNRPPALLTVYGALAAFALLTFASVVAARISPEFIDSRVNQHLLVIPSRYYTALSFLWASLAGISIWLAMKDGRAWRQLAATSSMVAVVTVGTVFWQIGEASNWRGYYRDLDVAASALIMHVNDPANPALSQIYPDVSVRTDVSAWLEARKLALFSQKRARLVGRRVAAGDVQSAECRGEVQAAVPVLPGVLRITGWALDIRTGRPPRDLVVVDRHGLVVGVARSGLRRPDLKRKPGAASLDTVGWQGYARSLGEPVIEVFGVIGDTGLYCRVGQPVTLSMITNAGPPH